MEKIAVIGAGILGVNTAYFLSKAGYEVTVFDSERYAGMETSFSNAGQISACNAETWTTWKNISSGIKWMFRDDAPLKFNPLPNILNPYETYLRYKWCSHFFLTSLNGSQKINSEKGFEISLRSRELYLKIVEEEGLDFDFLQRGILQIVESESQLDELYAKKNWIENMGIEWDCLDKEGVYKVEPALKANESIVGGIFTKSDASGDIHKFCVALSKNLRKKYGVTFKFSEKVKDISGNSNPYVVTEIDQYPFDKVVICAGVQSQFFSNKFKDGLIIYPVKGYSITIDLADSKSINSAPIVSVKDDTKKIACSRIGDRLRVAGTAELGGFNKDIRHARIQPLVEWTKKRFPSVETENFLPWAGLRPMTSTMMPVIRRSKKENVFYNTGHGHLGWTMGAYSGKLITDIIKS